MRRNRAIAAQAHPSDQGSNPGSAVCVVFVMLLVVAFAAGAFWAAHPWAH